jgi:hypothetical protein
VINYRQQGLAEKICKTHQIVLTKRSKDMVRSTKWLGWDLCVKGGILLGGYLQIYQETRINLRVTSISRGQNAKEAPHLLPLSKACMHIGTSWLLTVLTIQATRSTGEARNRKRR